MEELKGAEKGVSSSKGVLQDPTKARDGVSDEVLVGTVNNTEASTGTQKGPSRRDSAPTSKPYGQTLTDQSLASSSESAVSFLNQLEFPIEIYDSLTRENVASLEPGQLIPLVTLSNQYYRSWLKSQNIQGPSLFDLKVMGILQHERLPLFHLPLNINKPRPYYLLPNMSAFGAIDNHNTNLSSTASLGSEPIVEEIYENQRYNPLETRWSKPWIQLNDPPEWTTVDSKPAMKPAMVKLPSERWEWVEDDWRVDCTGVIGQEIDEHGW